MSINLQVNQGAFVEKSNLSSTTFKNDELQVEDVTKKDLAVDVAKEEGISDSLEKQNIKLEEALSAKLETKEQEKQLKDAMSTISEFLNLPIRSVNFAQHEGSDKTVIKIFDTENQELIKQFPSEEILSIAQRIVELQQDVGARTGILLDESI
jgi:flagellar protein FlaG